MNRLLLLAHRPGSDGHKTEVCVTSHHPRWLSALDLDHVHPIHGHGMAVGAIRECGGRGAEATFVVVANEVQRWDAPKQIDVGADSRVVRKPLLALIGGCHQN